MRALGATGTTALAWLGQATNRTLVLPLVIFFPTSRCNSRCVSCDWWKSDGKDDLTLDEIDATADALADLGTRLVVFSGGEPLVRRDVFEAAAAFRHRGIKLHLLTSGISLASRAIEVARCFERVIVSLDAASSAEYAYIRGVDGLDALERGVAALAGLARRIPVTARATLHRANFRELPRLIRKAHDMGLAGISFLPADMWSSAFGRRGFDRPRQLLLSRDDIRELDALIDRTAAEQRALFDSGFVAQDESGLRRLTEYYAAMLGDVPFPPVACDAPWVSAVIEANGDVRPCFFHRPLGNVRQAPLRTLVGQHLREFRAGPELIASRTCKQCVCSLKVQWRHAPWN